jgi:hypothetical protein
MSTSEWIDLLTQPQSMRRFFDKVPNLRECDLFYLHIDERDTSVTLGFDTRLIPDNPLPEWQRSDFNAFEFFITFTQVKELHISGWGGVTSRSVELSRSTSGKIITRIESPKETISFQADSASLSHSRVYLASGE